jgi:hypothetical protein
MICVTIPELVPATVDSLPSSLPYVFNYESVHIQQTLNIRIKININ